MRHIDQTVRNKGGVHIINRDLYLRCVSHRCFVKYLRIDQILKKDICNFPLKGVINFLLQLQVYREIHVFSRFGFLRNPQILSDSPEIIHIDFLFPVRSLKLLLQILLHAGFPDHGIQRIASASQFFPVHLLKLLG